MKPKEPLRDSIELLEYILYHSDQDIFRCKIEKKKNRNKRYIYDNPFCNVSAAAETTYNLAIDSLIIL